MIWFHWYVEQVCCPRGSTRGAALLRIGLAALVWSKYARHNRLANSIETWEELGVAAAVYLFSTTLFVGLFSRLSALLLGLTLFWGYFQLGVMGDDVEFWVHHHTYLLNAGVLFLAFTDCGRSFSVDRWWATRGGENPPELGDLLGMRLIAFQVAMVYVWGAYDKVYWAFGDRMEHYLMDAVFGSDYPPFPGFRTLLVGLGIATVAIEWVLPFTLTWKRTRWVSVLVGIALHGALYILLSVSTFSLTIVVMYLAFFPAAEVHAFVDRMVGRSSEP